MSALLARLTRLETLSRPPAPVPVPDLPGPEWWAEFECLWMATAPEFLRTLNGVLGREGLIAQLVDHGCSPDEAAEVADALEREGENPAPIWGGHTIG